MINQRNSEDHQRHHDCSVVEGAPAAATQIASER
jgi:hypothetical protein